MQYTILEGAKNLFVKGHFNGESGVVSENGKTYLKYDTMRFENTVNAMTKGTLMVFCFKGVDMAALELPATMQFDDTLTVSDLRGMLPVILS